jgi:hypothetical protein
MMVSQTIMLEVISGVSQFGTVESVQLYATVIFHFLRTISPPSLEHIQIHQSSSPNMWIGSQRPSNW